MKRPSLFLLIFAVSVTFFLVTGFQCGSTEMTSARLYIQSKDWANAEKTLRKELDKNPGNSEAWFLLGEIQYNTAKFEEMTTSFDNAMKDAAFKSDSAYIERVGFYKQNAWIIVIKSGIASSSRISQAPADSVMIYGNKALNDYRLAATIQPESVITYQNMAVTYAQLKQEDKQVEMLEKVRRLSKVDTVIIDATNELANIYVNRGTRALDMNDKAGAEKHFNSALSEINQLRKTNPNNQDLLKTMVQIYTKLDKQDEAMKIIKELVQKDPNDIIYQNQLAFLLSKKGNVQEAIEHIEAALKIDGNNQDALNNGGLLYDRLAEEMKKEAEAKAEKSKDKKVDKSYIEKYKRSAELFKTLTTLKPNDPNIFEALASALLKAGDTNGAKKAMADADALRKK